MDLTVCVYLYKPSALVEGKLKEGHWDNSGVGDTFTCARGELHIGSYDKTIFTLDLYELVLVSDTYCSIDVICDDLCTQECTVKYNTELDQWYITIHLYNFY